MTYLDCDIVPVYRWWTVMAGAWGVKLGPVTVYWWWLGLGISCLGRVSAEWSKAFGFRVYGAHA